MPRRAVLVLLLLTLCSCSLRSSPTPEVGATVPVEAARQPTAVAELEDARQPEESVTLIPTSSPKPTSPPASPTVPTATPTPVIYVVQAGDTVGQIAAKYNVSTEAVAAANNLRDVNLINVGQRLTIPSQETTVSESVPAEAHTPAEKAPTQVAEATPAGTTPQTAGAVRKEWGEICHPWPGQEDRLAASMEMDTTVELEGYLYVKSASLTGGETMAFTLRGIPYVTGDNAWSKACQIHAWIPIGTGPNHVSKVPSTFKIQDVVVWDRDGREIGGWYSSLDSRRVRLVGKVARAYGTQTGLSGSNTISLEEIELLE